MKQPNYITIDGSGWQWAEEYICAMATYTIACPSDRTCQVGMGVMALGVPRGEKIRFSGQREITVFGVGSLHFRVDDEKGPCKVGFVQEKATNISWPWNL